MADDKTLVEIAEKGESEATPWLVIDGAFVVVAAAFLVALALALIAYMLAS
jgi:hypothetical protein